MMARISGKDTLPELLVRRYLHAAGLRYRIHAQELPGKPDVVFRPAKVCVFIHGCFWHGCAKCRDGQRKPRSNRSYWLPKIRRNKRRDQTHVLNLRGAGWAVFVIWECEIEKTANLERLVAAISVKRARTRRHPATSRTGRGLASIKLEEAAISRTR